MIELRAGSAELRGAELEDDTLVAANRGCAMARVGVEAVLLDESGTYYGLNEVGCRIWELIQEPRSLGDVVGSIVQEFDVSPDPCRHDVRELVSELRRRGLVQFGDTARP